MTTIFMTETATPATLEIPPSVPTLDRPIVRVIWGRALGSTYQRYLRPGRLPLGTPAGQSVTDGGSMFSMPLTCPTCRGSFELKQPHRDYPDRLMGKCSCCGTSARLDIGDDGKITLVGLVEMAAQA